MKIPEKVYDAVVPPLMARLERIENGEEISPWHKSWSADGTDNALEGQHRGARNGVSKRQYNGVNWVILNLLSPHISRDWFTINQLKTLTNDPHPIPDDQWRAWTEIIFFKKIKINDADTGGEKMIPLARLYRVWNRDQIPGLPEPKPDLVAPDFDPKTEIDTYLANLKLKGGVHIGGDRAFFMPSDDAIGLPQDSAFTCEFERESTKAHEGIHATGAKHRLNRKRGSKFGDAAYAYEELVAELGAAMTCSYLGVPLEKLQHTQYVKTWLKKLKDDKTFLFSAAAEANKGFQLLAGVK